jgi:hypothetical protein
VFNPEMRVDPIRLDGGKLCYVADDALLDPRAVVQFAVENRERFVAGGRDSYPGINLALPEPMVTAILGFFNATMRRYFDARRLVHGMARCSMVTLAVDELRPSQMLCHWDNPVGGERNSITAAVLYLFRDERLGGTSFYEALRPPAETLPLFIDSRRMSSAEFEQAYGLPQAYMVDSNSYFTRIGTVAAKWNRLVFYDGSILHSGDIRAPEQLTRDPSTGRLTLNLFFSCRRNLA